MFKSKEKKKLLLQISVSPFSLYTQTAQLLRRKTKIPHNPRKNGFHGEGVMKAAISIF